ncbi:MAG: WD40 repeat domain-containing protein [Prochloraceae cyanobacterium]|nr:WD40 repeat domain-containing protein [Prochloraceae cyanobacterium]
MEQWLNLLFKVASPVFKTIVYAGTSNLLNEIQDELKKQQKHQAKMMFDSLGISSEIEVEKEQLNFTEKKAEIAYQKTIEIQNIVKDVTSSISQASLDYQQQRFQQEKALQQKLVDQKRQTILQLAAYQRETTLLLPEVKKIFDLWPLKLLPIQLLQPRERQEIPLKVLIAPPKLSLKLSDKIDLKTEEIESRITQELREFLSENYSLHSQIRPTEFLGGAWESQNFYGEASIKALFWMLKSEPTLILESEFEGDYLYFRMAYWGLGQQQYCYKTIFKISYPELIEESAKARAKQWKGTQEKLLLLGKTTEEIQKIGGINAINLAILEEAERLQSAGIDLKDLEIEYQFSNKDIDALCQFVSVCYCLVAGWMSDIHYLVNYDRAPLLPELLPKLVENVAEQKLLQGAIATTVSIYQEVFQVLAAQRPYWMPELALKLAESLTHLPDSYLAKQQIEYSLKIWLQQRQLSEKKGLKDLKAIESTLTIQDREYLENLKACLLNLGDDRAVEQVESLLESIADSKKRSQQDTSANFSLALTHTRVSAKIVSFASNFQSQRLISIDRSNIIEIWELSQAKATSTNKLKLNSEALLTFAIAPDGETVVSSDRSQHRSYLKIWHLETGKLQRTLFGHKKPIRSLAIAKDGKTLASGSHKIKLWNLQTGESFQTLFGHKEWVHCLAITADSCRVISGSEDKSVRIWDIKTGALKHTFKGHQGAIKTVAISPDDRIIASAGEDKTIKLWDLRTGKLLRNLTGHLGAIKTVAISPDAEYVISCSADKTVKIWHLERGELLQTLEGHSEAVMAIALSRDGQILASSSLDKTVKIWRRSSK